MTRMRRLTCWQLDAAAPALQRARAAAARRTLGGPLCCCRLRLPPRLHPARAAALRSSGRQPARAVRPSSRPVQAAPAAQQEGAAASTAGSLAALAHAIGGRPHRLPWPPPSQWRWKRGRLSRPAQQQQAVGWPCPCGWSACRSQTGGCLGLGWLWAGAFACAASWMLEPVLPAWTLCKRASVADHLPCHACHPAPAARRPC